MYPTVKEVVANNDFTLFRAFENGKSGILDMKPMLVLSVFQRVMDKKLPALSRSH